MEIIPLPDVSADKGISIDMEKSRKGVYVKIATQRNSTRDRELTKSLV